MPRRKTHGITIDRLPEEIRPYVPSGRTGEALADWYLTFEAGRRFGERHGSPEMDQVLGLMAHIDSRLDQLVGMPWPDQQESNPKGKPRLAVITPPREDWDTDDAAVPVLPKPQPDNEIALSDADLHTVAAWVHEVMQSHAPGDTEKEAQAMDAAKRILLGFTDRPDGLVDKGPPWKNLPSQGFEGILFARFARMGLVPEPKEDGSGWKTLGETN